MSAARRSGLRALLSLLIPLTALTAGCVFDADERCGENMNYAADLHSCICAENAISVPGACTACADDEVVENNACACPAGEVKNDVGICATVAGLGDPCDTQTSNSCADATYNYCAATGAGSAGVCTSTCTVDADCGTTYTCADWEPVPYCRPFTGVGRSCTSQADCAGLDAALCDTQLSHSCIVGGCTVEGDECPRSQECCDYTSFGFGFICQAACL